jgi:hypothetical protein
MVTVRIFDHDGSITGEAKELIANLNHREARVQNVWMCQAPCGKRHPANRQRCKKCRQRRPW